MILVRNGILHEEIPRIESMCPPCVEGGDGTRSSIYKPREFGCVAVARKRDSQVQMMPENLN